MTRWKLITLGALLSTSFALPAVGHHSFRAVFDKDCPVALEGPVTEVLWVNPHVWFHVDVTGDDGAVTNWAFELGSPNSLARRGWRPDTLKLGDSITISGFCSRDGKPTAAAQTVTLADGTELFGAQRIPR